MNNLTKASFQTAIERAACGLKSGVERLSISQCNVVRFDVPLDTLQVISGTILQVR